MNARKWGLAAVLVLLFGGVTWAYYSFRTDPEVAKVREIQQQMRDESVPEEQRRAMWGEMRESMRNLSEAQRDQLGSEMFAQQMRREDRRMREFFAKPKQEQLAQLDKEIKEEEQRRRDREQVEQVRQQQRQRNGQTGGQGDQGGGRGGPGGGGPGGGGQGGGGGGGRGFGGGGGGGGRGNTPERRVQRLDGSTPEQRAMRNEYRREKAERRMQLGLPPEPPGGGRGFGGGGRGGRGGP